MIAALLRPLLVTLLLGPFLLAPAAQAATSEATIRTILRDCEDDGRLSGSYRASELRDARRNIGTDLDQYSDCRDVLSAAEARASSGGAARSGGGGGGDGGQAGGGGGGGSGGGAASADGDAPGLPPAGPGSPDGGSGGGALLSAESPEEQSELDRLKATPPRRPLVGGRPVDLGNGEVLAASISRPLPTPLLIALVMLVAAGLGACVPYLRRRVLDRRTSA